MKQKVFKGGSLSSTFMELGANGECVVTKKVSLEVDREYGYQRWYSQLQKMLRFNFQFPGLAPRILSYGAADGYAYYSMDFCDAKNGFEYLCAEKDPLRVEVFFQELLRAMKTIHQNEYESFSESISLYLMEEVHSSLRNCKDDPAFLELSAYKKLIINNFECEPITAHLDSIVADFSSLYTEKNELITHGNLTLENLLFDQINNKVIFIDLYEETGVNSGLAEWSQLYQSSNSYYELLNSAQFNVQNNSLVYELEIPVGISLFNQVMLDYVNKTFSPNQIRLIELFEITQFIRMLPFKMKIDKEKMKLFFMHASYLYENYRRKYCEKVVN